MMAFRFSVLLQLSSCTYVFNYFSENARIKFILIDADVSGVVMAYFCFIFQFPNLICYGLVDWLIRYPVKYPDSSLYQLSHTGWTTAEPV